VVVGPLHFERHRRSWTLSFRLGSGSWSSRPTRRRRAPAGGLEGPRRPATGPKPGSKRQCLLCRCEIQRTHHHRLGRPVRPRAPPTPEGRDQPPARTRIDGRQTDLDARGGPLALPSRHDRRSGTRHRIAQSAADTGSGAPARCRRLVAPSTAGTAGGGSARPTQPEQTPRQPARGGDHIGNHEIRRGTLPAAQC